MQSDDIKSVLRPNDCPSVSESLELEGTERHALDTGYQTLKAVEFLSHYDTKDKDVLRYEL